MAQPSRWRLEDLYPDPNSPEFQQALQRVEAEIQAFEGFRPRLTPDLTSGEFLDMIQQYEDLVRLLSRIINYGFLLFSEDMRSKNAQSCWSRVQQIAAQAERRTLFFSSWWNDLDEKQAEMLMEDSSDYRYWLEAMRLQKPFTLSETEEKIVGLKDAAGSKGLLKLYETITGRYVFKLKIKDEIKEFTRHELSDYVRDPDLAVRAGVYQEYLRIFEQDAPLLGQIYQSVVRDWHSENVLLRGYASPISVRNVVNDLPDEVVEVLLEVCRKNAFLFHRYFRLKARTLGMERLRRYDIYAPVTRGEKRYQFSTAVELVLESFREFDSHLADLANQVLAEHHLDSEVREGKRPGAYCVAVESDLTPWISTSFEGDTEDIAALARELGRAAHYMMASHHTAFTQKPSRMLSDVASSFSEMLAIDHLINAVSESETQRELLFKRMDHFYTAILRQVYFVMFEQAAHDRIQAGASVNELNDVYLALLKDQFSDSIDLSDDFRYEWLGISTFFHLPFYAYEYAFSRLLVLSLYRQYQVEGEPFKSRYLETLAAGGSLSPKRILSLVGIDITSREAWQTGFDALTSNLEELEGLEGLRSQE
jgi:oligoendopeptidase F